MKREHYRPFNPEQAKAGAPYGCADDNYEAFVDWYGPDYVTGRCKSVVSEKWCARRWCELTNDDTEVMLVMIPIATCQGKPVFVGDTLYDENGDKFQADMNCLNVIPRCTWEPARSRVSTSYSGEELAEIWSDAPGDGHDSHVYVANAAIQRAIADGDVVPKETVREIAEFCNHSGIGMSDRLLWQQVIAKFFTKD